MPSNYMGSTDAARVSWMLTFAAALVASPATYGITAPEAAAIETAVDTYDAAFAIGGVTNRIRNNPATYTVVTVQDKDTARIAAVSICQQYYRLIQVNAGVSDMDKLAAGVRPLNPGPHAPIPSPATFPLLSVLKATPGSHTLAFADDATPSLRAKPVGVIALQLYTAIADAAVATPATALFYGLFTKNYIVTTFDPADEGKVCTYFGRWNTRRGLFGPWSSPMPMTIAF